MAYQLAQAYVQIVPSMKGVGKAIESAFDGPSKSVGQKAGDTAGGGFSRGFSAKLGVISGVASSIATKVIGVFSGLSGQILDASDSTQKFAQTLDFAGVGADQIKKLTTSTQEYANKTVYGIDDIRNTTAQLAANGVPNYDKLAEAAGNLNAVAGGNSETFKSVAMMLTQTAGAGKLTTENWNQLADAIPGASGKLQEAMLKNGAYTGNFRDAMAKGEITSQEFNDALMQLGMNDGAIKAAESTQTFEGAFGNLEATIVDGAANIVNTVKPYITGTVTALGDGIGKAMQWTNDFTGALMKSQGVQTFANGVKSIAGAVGSVIVPISGIIGYLFNFSGKADGAGTAAQRLSDVLGFVGGILQSVGTFVQQNADWMQALAIAVMAGYGAFQLFSIIQTVVGFVKAFSVAETAATAAQWLLNAAMSANPIMILVVAIAALVAGIVWFCTQTETGRQLWADFTGFLQATWQNITDFFQATWQNITQWFSNAAANIQNGWNALTAFIGSIPGRIQAFFASIGQWFVNKFNEARNGITGAFDNAVSFVSSIPGRITGFFGSISSWFADKFSEVRNGIANGFDSAVSFVASIPWRILSALGNLGGLLWDAGASIMQGFLDGLKSVWHNITSFVGNIAGWIADHKGPLPYDRKLLIPAGEAIMGGFRKSLNAGWQQVQADIMGMNVGLSNGFKTPAYVYGGSGMDYTPNTGSASNVHITNYYPQADPWPLSTNDSLDKMTVGI
ncbi:tape measure protein [Bifidobacterium longum]|uniref:tape measure protein n=1 Tax=Bifidobacterium longum TaxID=216816 RepID=UPI0020257D9B|nr:tape measure protein [Bifidobacterium longum]